VVSDKEKSLFIFLLGLDLIFCGCPFHTEAYSNGILMVDHIVCEDDLMVFSLSSPVFALFLIYIIMLVRVLSSSIEPKKAND